MTIYKRDDLNTDRREYIFEVWDDEKLLGEFGSQQAVDDFIRGFKSKEITPQTPNWENTEISFLCRD